MIKKDLVAYFDGLAPSRDKWRERNSSYHEAVQRLVNFLVPSDELVLDIGCGTGDLLASLKPSRGVGVDISGGMIVEARRKYPSLEWKSGDAENLDLGERFDYVIMSDLVGYLDDIEKAFINLNKVSHSKSKVVITHYNYFWQPFLRFAEILGLKAEQPLENWLSEADVSNLLYLAGFEVIKKGKTLLCPVKIPLISWFLNRIVAHLPLIQRINLIQFYVARPLPRDIKDYSVSIIIPCRNERGNIENAVKRLPHFGSYNEIIFIEGNSKDDTLEEIKRVSEVYAGKRNIRWAVQDGKGKGDAVRKGFAMAKGEILMILDADLTVSPEVLPKFYEALRRGRGEFVNGCRLVYPLEKESMRFFNIIGNKFFSIMFSWLLGQRIKDTLCGTKVLFKKDYEKIAANRSYFGDFDPFGDFDLLFGAAKLNLKIVELPIRYQARTYGDTNIQRWKHGMILLKMVLFAMKKIKFI